MRGKKGSKNGSSTRTKVVGVRLDPKLHYLAELAARKQRRSLSSFIEWAIEESLRSVSLDGSASLSDLASDLWDVDEPDRFVKLALRYEFLLTHEEQILWKLIQETGAVWDSRYRSGASGECYISGAGRAWIVSNETLLPDRLRKHWDDLKKVARGDADPSILPSVDNPLDDMPSGDIPS